MYCKDYKTRKVSELLQKVDGSRYRKFTLYLLSSLLRVEICRTIVFDVAKGIDYNKKEVGIFFRFLTKYHLLPMMTADRFVNLLLKVFKVLFENILPRDV